MATKLSADQVLKNSFDEVTGSLKTTPSSATTFSIELDANDGDSVTTYRRQLSSKTAGLNNTNTGTVVAEFSVAGITVINMHSVTATTISGPQVLTLQFSPHATDDVWINTSVTLTPSTTAGNIVSGTQISTLNAVRCRVRTAAAITSGSYDLYIVGN
jgi:hypothetical protein